MKIEELIKKTGDKLISQKDKMAYFMAVKKLELIAKIPDKKQRSEAMGKFKDILAKKVTPVVMAALTAISPVVLAGCDKTNDPNETQIAYVTDTNGEYVTGENGEPLTTIISSSNEPIADFEFSGLTEKMKENLQAYFSDFDFNKVLNGEYSKSVNEYYGLVMDGEIDAERYRYLECTAYSYGDFVILYSQFIEKIIGGDDKIALNIDFTGADADIMFYREGVETAGFILKYSNGQMAYNGVFNNEVYADGQEYLKNVPIAINEERKAALEQLNSTELGKIYGDEIICYFFDSDIWRNQKGLKALAVGQYDNINSHKDYRLVKRTSPEYNIDDNIIPAFLHVLLNNTLKDVGGVKEEGGDLVEIYFEVGEEVYRPDTMMLGDLEISFHPNYVGMHQVAPTSSVRLATIQLDLDPQNIQLPTTEAEAER